MTIRKTEFCADINLWIRICGAKVGVENEIKLRYYLRSMGVHVTQKTQICGQQCCQHKRYKSGQYAK